jgi:hypothetical protein
MDFTRGCCQRAPPKPRRLASLADARAFVDEAMKVGRSPPWREVHHRLATVSSEEEANEAIDALRELLNLEDLLVSNLPPNSSGSET